MSREVAKAILKRAAGKSLISPDSLETINIIRDQIGRMRIGIYMVFPKIGTEKGFFEIVLRDLPRQKEKERVFR